MRGYRPKHTSTKNLWNKYGMSEAQFRAIWDYQGFACAICGRISDDPLYKWHVDHCPKTGFVRGILCASCNYGLGTFKDSPDLLENAIEYLTNNEIFDCKIGPKTRNVHHPTPELQQAIDEGRITEDEIWGYEYFRENHVCRNLIDTAIHPIP